MTAKCFDHPFYKSNIIQVVLSLFYNFYKIMTTEILALCEGSISQV